MIIDREERKGAIGIDLLSWVERVGGEVMWVGFLCELQVNGVEVYNFFM